jgi:predicted enzyme related to lactoylglutathione lyase
MSPRSTPWPHGTPCWVDLTTSDLPASTAFYRAVLGWEVADLGPDFGHYGIAMRDGLSTAGIGLALSPDQPEVWTTYLATDNADTTAEAIVAQGGKLISPVMEVGDEGRMAIALDPTGATFGIWQAKTMIGCQLVNEPGGIVWNDQTSPDPQTARRFYAAVFGYTYAKTEGTQNYTTINGTRPGETIGGIGAVDATSPPGAPAHWTVYFAVEDVEAAYVTAIKHDGAVTMPPYDTPYGRMAALRGPEGADFTVVSSTEATEATEAD